MINFILLRFKNKAIYPLIEKLHPQMRLLAEIKTIADEEPDTTVTMKENAEIERVEECMVMYFYFVFNTA